jgi:hypothetical protein
MGPTSSNAPTVTKPPLPSAPAPRWRRAGGGGAARARGPCVAALEGGQHGAGVAAEIGERLVEEERGEERLARLDHEAARPRRRGERQLDRLLAAEVVRVGRLARSRSSRRRRRRGSSPPRPDRRAGGCSPRASNRRPSVDASTRAPGDRGTASTWADLMTCVSSASLSPAA